MSSRNPVISTQSLAPLLESEGFEQYGFARLAEPVSIGFYEAWLAKGFQGEMGYLERHLEQKRDPQKLLAKARSAIVVTSNYVPHPAPVAEWPLSSSMRVAAYAKGRDYHHFLKERLNRVIARLKASYPEEEFVCFTDSAPVLERDLAKKAGLGWVGKNTCLLSRAEGSLFLIAEIYTTIDFATAAIEGHDHCGTCTRCLDACPTGALVAPRELDARKCISYLTIESREIPVEPLRQKIGDWLFGCDICQLVCPWNIKVHGKEAIGTLAPSLDAHAARESLVKDLRFLLTSTNRGLERAFQGTPLMRAGGWGLKRNALIVAANMRAIEVREEIAALLANDKLSSLASWALKEIDLPPREEPIG